MEQINYLELLNLPFETIPKENEIDQAIVAWKKRLDDLLGTDLTDAQRAAYKAELALEPDIIAKLKNKASCKAMAQELKEKRVSQLEAMLDIMLIGQKDSLFVTQGQIEHVSAKLNLANGTVRNIYKAKGFTIRPPAAAVKSEDLFITASTMKVHQKHLDELHKFAAELPWATKVNDLFALACYINGENDSRLDYYRKMSAAELQAIMNRHSVERSTDGTPVSKALWNLLSMGDSQIFSSENSKAKYVRSLKREGLKEFFELVKRAPDVFKTDPYFAESCIREIQKSFPDYDTALALYNQELGLRKKPYEPIDPVLHVVCGACEAQHEFRSRGEAERSYCCVCGAPLYVKCAACGKLAPASAEWCGCGFRISEMRYFDNYISAAQTALDNMDLREASKQLANAENAHPKHPKLLPIRQKIEAERKKHQKTLDELDSYIAGRKFVAAQAVLDKLAASAPQLNMESQRTLVSTKIKEAANMMPSSQLNPRDRADRCVAVLDIVKDYQPAIDVLASIPPAAPRNMRGAVSAGGESSCELTWRPTGEKGISYRVVRKKNSPPKAHNDGVVIADNLFGFSVKDMHFESGIRYEYAVFAYREGVYSQPAYCTLYHYADINRESLRASAENGVCRFSWSFPQNCIGVRILRSTNAVPDCKPSAGSRVIAERAAANFNDTTVANDTTYGYRLQCVYSAGSDFIYSDGCTVMLTPVPELTPLRNVKCKVQDSTVRITWDLPAGRASSVIVREVVASVGNSVEGSKVDAADLDHILGKGKVYANTTSSATFCSFMIPPNASVKLAVLNVSGSQAVISEIYDVSSVKKCEINRTETQIDGTRLKIMLQNLPPNLQRIHYIVNKKVGEAIPWASVEDAKFGRMRAIDVNQYYRDGMILVDNPPKENLYITVIGEYNIGGRTVFSDSSRMRVNNTPKKQIRYYIRWEGLGLFSRKPKKCVLCINCPSGDIPRMKLIYRNDGFIPNRYDDPKNVCMATVKESNTREGTYEIPPERWEHLPSKTNIRLMMSEEDRAEYEFVIEKIDTLQVP